MAALQCEICGGKLMAKSGGLFECEYCGMQYDKTRIQEMVQEIKGTVKVEGTVEVKGTVKVEGGINVENLLKRGWMALEDEKWDEASKAFDNAKDLAPENAQPYLGRYLCRKGVANPNLTLDQYEELFYRNWKYSEETCASDKERYHHKRDFPEVTRIRKLADSKLEKWFREMDLRMEALLRTRKEEARQKAEEVNHQRQQTIARLAPIRARLKKVQNRFVAAGGSHTVGLKTDGTVVVTQFMERAFLYHGQNDNVADWRDIVAVSAGDACTFGLKADGTVMSTQHTGHQDYLHHEWEVGDWNNIIAVSAGNNHTLGVRSNGMVMAVGSDEYGKCEVLGWRNIIAVAAGENHSVGLRADGTVVAVGWEKNGRCDTAGWTDIVAIAATWYHTVGLKNDGTVILTGENKYNWWNVSGWSDIVAIAAGYEHIVGLKSNGSVVATGRNEYGQCNVDNWTGIVAIDASRVHTVGLKADGTVVAAGWEKKGQCDVGEWKLFNSLETLEQERLEARRIAEENRRQAERQRQERIAVLNEEKETVSTELSNLKGFFTGKRRRELEARLAEIETELKGLN